MVGVADRDARRIATVSKAQVLKLKRDGVGSIGDTEVIAVLGVSAGCSQIAIEHVDSRVCEQADIDSAVASIAGVDPQAWEGVDRRDHRIDHIVLSRGAAESNRSATGDGRTAEVPIEFEDRCDVSVRDGKRRVVRQIRTASGWNLQEQSSEDFQARAALDSWLTEQADRRGIGNRDRVFGGATDDHIPVADVLRGKPQTGSGDRIGQSLADLRLGVRRAKEHGDIACGDHSIGGEFEGRRRDRSCDISRDRNPLAVLNGSRHADNIQFGADHIDSACVGQR